MGIGIAAGAATRRQQAHVPAGFWLDPRDHHREHGFAQGRSIKDRYVDYEPRPFRDHWGGLLGFLEKPRKFLPADLTMYAGGEDNFCQRYVRAGQTELSDYG